MPTFYYDWILYDQLMMGSTIPSEKTYRDLIDDKGVTHILDLERDCDLEFDRFSKPSPKFLHLYFPDDGTKRPNWYWEFGFEFARRAIQNGGTVFVHCQMGRNRGPCMTYGILEYFNAVSEELVSNVKEFDRDPVDMVFPGEHEPIYQAQIDQLIEEEFKDV
jgi:protein-tyrosine phosphatase